MRNNIHTKFILTPIVEILKETATACRCIGIGIETQPLCEYVMQTTFLKMTGASEQKLKCICWEMATYDYEYRYQKLTKTLGECSCYGEKKAIFNDILKVIGRMDSNYDFNNIFSDSVKTDICDKIKEDICSTISNTVVEKWESRSFLLYKNEPLKYIDKKSFTNKNTDKKAKSLYSFLEEDLKDYYENVVYRHRNRCAHNLKSYQNNLPTLKTLVKPNYEYENYFHMFSVLMLLDEIYIVLYKAYLNLLDNRIP